jgi:hypothetical protein
MSNEQTNAALARIDAALLRLETAISRQPSSPASGALETLKARHEALRMISKETLGALETLISGEETR